MASVFERVRSITVDKLNVEESRVTLDSSFTEDFNADSLDIVELIMEIEEQFSTDSMKLSIPDEDTEKIATVRDAVEYIKSRGIKDE